VAPSPVVLSLSVVMRQRVCRYGRRVGAALTRAHVGPGVISRRIELECGDEAAGVSLWAAGRGGSY
jgi:hypothetical protein